jgi:hypothetical protein
LLKKISILLEDAINAFRKGRPYIYIFIFIYIHIYKIIKKKPIFQKKEYKTVKSGCGFMFDECESEIRKWTDKLVWSF